MTVDEVFSRLTAHMVKGFMMHDQMATAYNFLGLKGYKKCLVHLPALAGGPFTSSASWEGP